jgi:hypothetical protein
MTVVPTSHSDDTDAAAVYIGMGSADSYIIPDDSLHSLPEDLHNRWIFHKVYNR